MATERLDGTDAETVLPLLKEVLRIDKQRVETGRVRVSVATEIEERLVHDTLRAERVEVERVAIGRELAVGEAAPSTRREVDGTLVIPVLEEVLVVERRLVLKEEIRLRHVAVEEAVEQSVTLRRQTAEVKRIPPNTAVAPDNPGSSPVSGDRAD